ncbi:MAG: hypothetical protein AB7U83_19830 [Vicinamibacterales bacterium]
MPIPSTTVQRPVSKRDEAGQLAHDLNNLLAVIGGHADAIEPSMPAGGEDYASVQAIQRAVAAGAKLAERVRRLGGAAPVSVRGVDVGPIVARTTDQAAERFGHRLSVSATPPSRLWSAAVDPELVSQALWQLVTTAVDVMPHGGALTVRCMNVEFGAGGTSGRRDRYVRVELSGQTVVSGEVPPAGGGAAATDAAALTEALVAAGGRISTESDGASMATWALLLPSDGVEPLAATAPDARAGSVLVVDGDQTRGRLVQAVLQRHGFAADVTASLDDAARTLASRPVDLMVADAALCGGAGDAVAVARRHAVRVLPIAAAGVAVPGPALRAPFNARQLMQGVEAAFSEPATGRPSLLPIDGLTLHSEGIA